MERSPKDDRGGTLHRNAQRKPEAQNDRSDQLTAGNPPSPAEQLQQKQQGERMRDFAPGEDGECH